MELSIRFTLKVLPKCPINQYLKLHYNQKQAKDLPYDMVCHKDSEGNIYDFGFGMNWKGLIKDGRGAKHKK